ncbi:tRNA dihydrouridine synthase [Treponema primitia]|uniref:tRNA dihydrouridine synthase n=1 Tax=Treponema primitia TaxID=88058 RepID=UPI001FE155D8|nr:tRNA-dihydrouridine synthase family protein [Treponema primitia]
MAELSHRALRELIEGFGGCDEYFTEMISAGALIGGGPFESWYIDGGPCPEKLVYQLVGADPGHLAAATALLDRLECRGIDINMGCSAPAITRTGAGVRWMASMDAASAMIDKVRAATRRRLSVKLRIGLEDNFDYLVEFCRRLEACGVELITLHPRTAKEKFKRRARWEYVGQLRDALGIPVAGNGDIANSEDLVRRAASGCCDAVMAGRAAVRQPWLFAQARAAQGEAAKEVKTAPGTELGEAAKRVTVTNPGETPGFKTVPGTLLEETGLRFLELLARYQPPEFHLSRARRFFNYFCDNLKWGNYVKNLLGREADLAGIGKAWTGYFAEHEGEP